MRERRVNFNNGDTHTVREGGESLGDKTGRQ